MVVLGLSFASQLVFEGKIKEAIGTFLFFLAIPIGIAIVSQVNIPWGILAGFILVAIGAVTIGKALLK